MEDFKEAGDLSPAEIDKLVKIEELAESGDVIPVPAQISFGLSIFAMSDGPPIVHVTEGSASEINDGEVPIEWLLDLLRQAQDGLLFTKFKQNLAADQMRLRAQMQREPDRQGG